MTLLVFTTKEADASYIKHIVQQLACFPSQNRTVTAELQGAARCNILNHAPNRRTGKKRVFGRSCHRRPHTSSHSTTPL